MSQQRSIRQAALQHARQITSLLGNWAQLAEFYFALQIALRYQYRARPDDLFVVSYPKSGTTLMQMMLYQMTTPGEMDFPHIESVSPWFENHLLFGFEEHVERVPSPRIFKSHLHHHHLPPGARTIYLARELHDVVISAYHHLRLVRGVVDLDLASFADGMLAGRSFFGSWFKHMESWWPHRNDPNVLFLRFEEVIADLPGTMRRVAGFCGLPLDAATEARVLERCSLSFMKQHDEKFDPRQRQLGRGRLEFIRHGVAGEGRAVLTPAQDEAVARRLRDLGRKLGCTPGEPHRELFGGDAPADPTRP